MFGCHLSNRKQITKFSNENTDLEIYHYGVPQGSILDLFQFLIFANDLKRFTNLLDLSYNVF